MAYYINVLNNTDGNTYKLKVPVFGNDSDAETYLKAHGDILKENCNNEYKYQRAPRTWSGDVLNAQLNALPAEILGVGGVYMPGDTTKDIFLGAKTSYLDTLPLGVYTIGNGTMTITDITNSVVPFTGTMWGGTAYSFTGRGIVYNTNPSYNYLTGVNSDFGFSRYGVTTGASRAYYSVNLCMAYYNSTTDRVILVDYNKWGDSDTWRYYRQFEFTGVLLKENQIEIIPEPSDDLIDTATGEGGDEDEDEQIGGEGSFDFNDINITVNTDEYTNNTGLIGSGIATLKKISYGALQQIGAFLYSSDMVEALQKFFAGDAEKAIIDLYQLPVDVPAAATATPIKFGSASSNIMGNNVTAQIYDIDMGSVDLTKINSNSFVDFSPYTEYFVFLPFIGVRKLETNLVRSVNDKGTTLSLKYKIDVITGDLVAKLIISSRKNYAFSDADGKLSVLREKKNFIIKEFTGNCKKSLPRGSSNTLNDILSGMSSMLSGGLRMAGGGAAGIVGGLTQATQSIQNIAGNHIESSGVSSNLGYLSMRTPYLMCLSPVVYSRATRFGQLNGYASEKFKKLNENCGYVKVRNVIASGFTGTAHEQEMVVSLLKKGVWCK